MYFDGGAQMNYEIINKETGETIGTYATYEAAMAAYEKLGTGNGGMTDHAIGEKE
jgi:hypothetical protein